VYEFLPLGLRVVNKISNIIRAEMDAIGGQELKMTLLQDPEPWKRTNRWGGDKVDSWFQTTLQNKQDLGLGFTHEEPLAVIMKDHIQSYRDLPVYPYQIQAKLRNEVRAKSGILRGREFLMKDMYSFSRNQEEHDEYYEKVKEAYQNIFKEVSLGDRTFVTFASGGAFSKYSHEFQTLVDAGEDTVYLDREKGIAINKEVFTDEVVAEIGLIKDSLEEVSATEVGNIFTLGNRFSQPLGLFFEEKNGSKKPVIMGSYGLGVTRLMGVITEVFADDRGLVWPETVAPFKVHLLQLSTSEDVKTEANNLYHNLQTVGVEVLFDDRNLQPGEKFTDADLLGIPYRIVVSSTSLEAGGVELKKRTKDEAKIYSSADVINILK
jgi:prolyl-tRNA synthetase